MFPEQPFARLLRTGKTMGGVFRDVFTRVFVERVLERVFGRMTRVVTVRDAHGYAAFFGDFQYPRAHGVGVRVHNRIAAGKNLTQCGRISEGVAALDGYMKNFSAEEADLIVVLPFPVTVHDEIDLQAGTVEMTVIIHHEGFRSVAVHQSAVDI